MRDKLKICEEGVVHHPGGFIADTQTLCGMASVDIKETNRKRVTCNGCNEIYNRIIEVALESSGSNPPSSATHSADRPTSAHTAGRLHVVSDAELLRKALVNNEQLCRMVNDFAIKLGLGRKVREEDFAEPLLQLKSKLTA